MKKKKSFTEQPLATVNDKVILTVALTREMEQLAASVYGTQVINLVPAQKSELRKNSITKLIREELILASPLAEGMEPSAEELKSKMDEAQLGILVQGGENLIDDEGFQARLKESLVRELTIHRVIDLFLAEANVADEDVEGFYKFHTASPGVGRFQRDGRVELSEIFLAAEHSLCPAGRSALVLSLKSFKGRIESGEAFEDLAKEHSQRESNKADGGRIGWAERQDLEAGIYDAAALTSAGNLTEVLPIVAGYLLLKVHDKNLTLLPLDAVREEIVGEIKNDQAKAAFKLWVDQMMEQADIRVGGGPGTWNKRCNC